MIQIILRGGMGNQMFEYAAGLSLAKKYNTDLVLDTTFLSDRFPRKNFTYRRYELDAFAIAPRFTVLSKVSDAVPIPGVWLGLALGTAKANDIFRTRKFIKEENEGHFDPSVLEVGGNVCLWGYWQSEKYFADIKDEVAQAFTFSGALPPAAEEIAREIKSTNAVALSVRRGDYVNAVNAKIFGGTDLAYYERAISYIAERVPSPCFYIFSDDVAWCRENIKPPFPVVYIPSDIEGRFAMRLSSLCKHQIIANSTFSWWGAWLNRNPEKIVVAPKRWHAGMEQDDVVPEGWMRI